MKKTAIIVAMEKELATALGGFGELETATEFLSKPVYRFIKGDNEVYILNSGVGEIAAAAATQHTIDVFGADLILNFGFVGSLRADLKQGDLVVVKEVVHYEMDTSALDGVEVGRYCEFPSRNLVCTAELAQNVANRFGLKQVVAASGNKFVASDEIRRILVGDFGADICEMESAGILLTALRNQKECLMIKLISDNADEGSITDFPASVKAGTVACAKIINDVLGE